MFSSASTPTTVSLSSLHPSYPLSSVSRSSASRRRSLCLGFSVKCKSSFPTDDAVNDICLLGPGPQSHQGDCHAPASTALVWLYPIPSAILQLAMAFSFDRRSISSQGLAGWMDGWLARWLAGLKSDVLWMVQEKNTLTSTSRPSPSRLDAR